MKNQQGRIIKIKINQNGSYEAKIKNDNNKTIGEVTAKNGRISKIEITRNGRDEAVHVTHSAWGNNFYHEDVKKNAPHSNKKINDEYMERMHQEKQCIKQIIKEVIKDWSLHYKKPINDNAHKGNI